VRPGEVIEVAEAVAVVEAAEGVDEINADEAADEPVPADDIVAGTDVEPID
jgi:hypothetical protein